MKKSISISIRVSEGDKANEYDHLHLLFSVKRVIDFSTKD